EDRRAQAAPSGTTPWLAGRAPGGRPVSLLAIRRGPCVGGLAGCAANRESRRSSGRLGQGVVLLAHELPLGRPAPAGPPARKETSRSHAGGGGVCRVSRRRTGRF